MAVFLSETNETFTNFDDKSAKVWQERNLRYMIESDPERMNSIVLPLTDHLYNNGSLFAHIFVYRDGTSPNPKSPQYSETFVYKSHRKKIFILNFNRIESLCAEEARGSQEKFVRR